MDLTHDDVTKILRILDSAPHLDDVEITHGDVYLHVQRSTGPAFKPSHQSSRLAAPAEPRAGHAPRAMATPEPTLAPKEFAIRAPMQGTFYRSPAPGSPPFVEIGQAVQAGDTVCLIEVMKLFSSINAGVDGVVRTIVPADGELVDFNQVLIIVETAGGAD